MKIEIVTFNFHGGHFWKRRRFFNLLSSIAATYFVAFVRGALPGTFYLSLPHFHRCRFLFNLSPWQGLSHLFVADTVQKKGVFKKRLDGLINLPRRLGRTAFFNIGSEHDLC